MHITYHSHALCPSCHRPFFAASLKIHLPQCRAKMANVITCCPACGVEMAQSLLNDHLQKCEQAQATSRAAGGPVQVGKAGTPATAMGLLPAERDGRVPCARCGRKFNAMAAERHIPKCNSIRSKPKTLVRGQQSSGPGYAPSAPRNGGGRTPTQYVL